MKDTTELKDIATLRAFPHAGLEDDTIILEYHYTYAHHKVPKMVLEQRGFVWLLI